MHSEADETLRFLRWCKDVRRTASDWNDWNKVIRQSRNWLNEHSHPSINLDRTLICNYALILIKTGIRVWEARILRWKDIRLETNGSTTEPNVVISVDGKTGDREVVSRNYENHVADYYQRIKTLYDELQTDEYISPHPNAVPILSLKKSFTSFVRFAGVDFDGKGNRHSIYSLRHTYASIRLTEGVSVYALARIMGTSIAMIERFYGQTRKLD